METPVSLFATIDHYLFIGSYCFLGLTLLIIIFHEFKVMSISDQKEKYDYVNSHEIKYFRFGVITFLIAVGCFLVAEVTPTLPVSDSNKTFISIFFLIVFGTIAYVTLTSIVGIVYPKLLEGRLKRIRNKPRKSSAGNVMRKLSDQEGSVHLEADQLSLHKSEIHSAEYDVWIDDKTGEKKIDKYMAYQHAEKCGECGYYTMKIDTEEIEKQPTQNEDGLLLEHYKCSYCKHREAREVVISALGKN
jgi:phage-related holin